MPTNLERLDAIRSNIFPAAHSAIKDWPTFPWHLHAQSRKSSQALAIDVFGTLQVASQKVRDEVCAEIAKLANLPVEGPWAIELEWEDGDKLLNEPRPTQVDVVATSPHAMMLFECKFTEAGGGCSQIKPNKLGMSACTGSYALQTNPQNGMTARCALSGKGIRYWDWIDQVYGLSTDTDIVPCPFAFDAYQWMRNTVLAAALRNRHRIATRVFATFADGPGLQTAEKVRSGRVGLGTRSENDAIVPLSYQDILTIAQAVDTIGVWGELKLWVTAKISEYAGQPS